MSAAPAISRRRGWCPGALRPMMTGDGLLVRLRLPGGVLRPDVASALAEAARRFGNGLLDLSSRANLQLRGVRNETLPALQDELGRLGLLDADPASESVRNVLASPLDGLDPTMIAPVGEIAAALDKALAETSALHDLPAKFSFVVDGGGMLPLGGVEADIRLVAVAPERFRIDAGGVVIGALAAADASSSALAAAHAFLRLRLHGERHMREVVARIGTAPLVDALNPSPGRERGRGEELRGCAENDPSSPASEAREGDPFAGALRHGSPSLEPSVLVGDDGRVAEHERITWQGYGLAGIIPLIPGGESGFFAAAISFGRLSADQLAGLAKIAAGRQTALRLTPWRAIILAPVALTDAQNLAREISALGLVTNPADPRLSVAACPGSPACASGEAPAQADAARFAQALRPLLDGTISVHVSGCPKGCARRGPATLAIVAAGGRYGLAANADAAAPRQTPLMDTAAMEAYLATLDRDRIAALGHPNA